METQDKTVLVVDDNRDHTDSIAMLLNIWGYRAVVAYDGAAALALATGPLTAALVDIGLPTINGYAVATELRRRYGTGLLIIAITGYQELARGRSLLFDHILTKPFDPEHLSGLLDVAEQPWERAFVTTTTAPAAP